MGSDELGARIDRLARAIESSPASYLMNGRKKWTWTVISGVLILLIGQAVIGGFYFIVKAPTVEWVENRINEKILNAPITRSADMRLTETNFRVTANEQSVAAMKNDVKDIKTQLTEIKVMLGVSMRTQPTTQGGS